MDIQDAFAQDNMDQAGTLLNSEDATVLKRAVTALLRSSGMAEDPEIADLCMHCFVAGRTYQSDLETMIDVSMSKEMAVDFMHYLVARESHE